MSTVKTLAICVIVAIAAGTIGYLIEWGITRVEVSTVSSERDRAILEKTTMQQQWEVAINDLNQTKVLLKDTLSALEVLRQYKAIDKDIKEDLAKIDKTLDPQGVPTEDTYDEFRKMVEEYNRLSGIITTGSSMITYAVLDPAPFREVLTDAQLLLKSATELVLKFKGK